MIEHLQIISNTQTFLLENRKTLYNRPSWQNNHLFQQPGSCWWSQFRRSLAVRSEVIWLTSAEVRPGSSWNDATENPTSVVRSKRARTLMEGPGPNPPVVRETPNTPIPIQSNIPLETLSRTRRRNGDWSSRFDHLSACCSECGRVFTSRTSTNLDETVKGLTCRGTKLLLLGNRSCLCYAIPDSQRRRFGYWNELIAETSDTNLWKHGVYWTGKALPFSSNHVLVRPVGSRSTRENLHPVSSPSQSSDVVHQIGPRPSPCQCPCFAIQGLRRLKEAQEGSSDS